MSNIVGTFPVGLKPKGLQNLTVDATTGGVGLTVPAGAVRAVLTVEAQPLRWSDNGTAPTSSVGVLELAGSRFELYGKASLLAFKAIRSTGSSSALGISYYGE